MSKLESAYIVLSLLMIVSAYVIAMLSLKIKSVPFVTVAGALLAVTGVALKVILGGMMLLYTVTAAAVMAMLAALCVSFKRTAGEVPVFVAVMYILYIICVIAVTLLRDSRGKAELMGFNFQAIGDALKDGVTGEEVWHMLLNAMLFMPLGFFVPIYSSAKPSVLSALLYSLLLSTAIESIQMLFALGLTDAMDILANVVGGVIGSLVFALIAPYCGWTGGSDDGDESA